MSKAYCDILPTDNGWAFVAEGYHSPSYPSYDLALQAATAYREHKECEEKSIILRFQTLKGSMCVVTPGNRRSSQRAFPHTTSENRRHS